MKTKVIVIMVAAAVAATPVQQAGAQGLLSTLYPQSCRTQQVIGGGAGALIGGLLGNSVASKKNRTEGAVLGGVIGALAGSQIGRMKCEADLKRAMIRQAIDSNQSRVAVPAGPLNRPMSAELRGTYLNERRQSCKTYQFDAAADGSAPSQTVTACDVDGTGEYQILST